MTPTHEWTPTDEELAAAKRVFAGAVACVLAEDFDLDDDVESAIVAALSQDTIAQAVKCRIWFLLDSWNGGSWYDERTRPTWWDSVVEGYSGNVVELRRGREQAA